ncbi:MAG: hypothetical protein LBQ89_09690 [Treponema sp.]|nr:hypothetical protein [Treponema sp.]
MIIRKKTVLCLILAVFAFITQFTCTSLRPEKRESVENITSGVVQTIPSGPAMIMGTDEGLFYIDTAGKSEALWTDGSVKKILNIPGEPETWIIMGSEGVLVSRDLRNWEKRNNGLPVKTIKVYENGTKSFLYMVQEIKDLEINPANPQIMVCATNNRAYLTRDQGRSWTDLGSLTYQTNGIKAVAVANLPDLTVFLSHSVYGIHYIKPNTAGSRWIELIDGIEKLPTTNNPNEVSDIAVFNNPPEIYISQSFIRRIYRLDWNRKRFSLVWSDDSPFGMVDSLSPGKDGLYFLHEGTAASINFSDYSMQKQPEIQAAVKRIPSIKPNCAVIEGETQKIRLSELWLLDEPRDLSKNIAANKEGLYLPVNHAMDSYSLRPYLETIERAGLNMIVIDMKDDYGRLRFTPNNPSISERGRVFRPLDIDEFLRNMKQRGIYTVARVVVFKDPVLAARDNNRYAVWDTRNGKPWVGYVDARRRKTTITAQERRNELNQFFPTNDPEFEIVRSFYDERWVDPYSEVVWDYTAALSIELHERGFDEIQFDYIRFPTDGQNLGDARFRWQENSMDRESAILSFLRHVRSRIDAPISIDIYGANGWYRTGARTGQEVELLAPWVDVICPMYYPSHFEQHFLAQNPPELRPWRIYYHGTLRTDRIGRSQIIIRPYVQAFYLNVSYDRVHYNEDYVIREIQGVREAGSGGFTYWNNSGRYADIPSK